MLGDILYLDGYRGDLVLAGKQDGTVEDQLMVGCSRETMGQSQTQAKRPQDGSGWSSPQSMLSS